jgi:hypothetical protein
MISRAKETVEDAYGRSSEKLTEAYRRGVEYSQSNPGKTACMVFGAGVGLGLLLAGLRRNGRDRVL